jgi:hypothetical protein
MTDAPEELDEGTTGGDDGLELPRRPGMSWGTRLLVLVLVAVLIGGVGLIGELSGVGWFNHRPMLYGEGELYVLNMKETEARVSIDGRPFITVPPLNAQLIEIIGGTSKVVVEREGAEVEYHTVTVENSDALLNLGGEKCLAVVDIQPYYGGKNPDDVAIVKTITAADDVVVIGSNNVVWPRKTFPPKLAGDGGPGRWVELVGCALLEEESYLQDYLNFRLRERMQKALGGE